MRNAEMNLSSLRLKKMDKQTVLVISAQKSGSTLLCYLLALINSDNQIQNFRNDFDLVPMLSFPVELFPQNFNARQDGHYQIYKINGNLRKMESSIAALDAPTKILWSAREFAGYFKSVYWWLREFYPRIGFLGLESLSWEVFQELTFESMAKGHVNELWYVTRLVEENDSPSFMPVFFEEVLDDKGGAIRKISNWLGIKIEPEVTLIQEKTTRASMAVGNRFDPVTFGDGIGLSKINVDERPLELHYEYLDTYQQIFRERFRDYGFAGYEELVCWFRARYGN